MSTQAQRAFAQDVTATVSPIPDLGAILLDERHIPAGLELESAGARNQIAQLAGTFRNSRDAARLLAGWGWVGNAYRSYAARDESDRATPARVEVSLHQFTTSTGAAYALTYFAHDRAVALQLHEELGEFLLPCEAMVSGNGSATRYLRRGSLVVRVTVVVREPVEADAGALARTVATELALAVLASTGEWESTRDPSCG